jgi:hypothetical protein
MTIEEFYRAYAWECCDECHLPAVVGLKEDDIEFYCCWEHGIELIVDDFGGNKIEYAVEVPWLDNKESTD